VGKTTVAAHVAVALARWHAARVLLVDLDPQAHVSRVLAQLLGDTRPEKPLSSVFLGKRADLLGAAEPTHEPGLWIARSDEMMCDVQTLVASKIGREFLLRNAMGRVQGAFDFVLFDCPPNVDVLTINALVAARHILVPTELSSLSIQGVSDICEAVDTVRDHLSLPVETLAIIPSRIDRRSRSVNRDLLAVLRERFGALVLQDDIPSATAVSRSCLRGRPVFDESPQSPASAGFKRVTRALCSRLLWRSASSPEPMHVKRGR